MAIERTLSIIKPNATSSNNIGNIIARFEKEGFRIAAMKFVVLSKEKAEGFYIEHKGKPFYDGLIQSMTAGPVVIMVIEGENGVVRNREIMGATDPARAAEGTLRKLYGICMPNNAVHGSDCQASAKREIDYFFAKHDIISKG